jgi:tetratricopeptide (TPR) repeat protein
MHVYDWEGAMESCQMVLRDDPDHLGALEILAQGQWFLGQYQAVIATTSHLLRLNPSEPGYRYTRGMAHLSRGELTRAQEDFLAAIAQSQDEAFRRQVAHSLAAVEQWMTDLTPRRSRFGQATSSLLGRVS